MTDDEQDQLDAAKRLAEVLERVMHRAVAEFGLSLAAVGSGLLLAAIQAARASMPNDAAVAGWLHDVAAAIEAGEVGDDLPKPRMH